MKRLRFLSSLRFKILIILAWYIFGILAMTFVAQNDLLTAMEKLEAVELAYSLHSEVLEARRYEKNYLLYGSFEAISSNNEQTMLALNTIEELQEKVLKFRVHPMLMQMKELVLSYRTTMAQLQEAHSKNPGKARQALSGRLRLQGQDMNELSKELVTFEHKQIRMILTDLRNQLSLWSVLAIIVGILFPLLFTMKIFMPLTVIKNATEDIARGLFNRIEVLNTRDEMQQVMEAFNTMVVELQRRQDQLVQSQKLSSIGTLSAGIAHQLNNPLNNISTSCQIAMSDFDSAEAQFLKKMLRNIDQETNRARDVVQGLLEFSREKDFELKPVNLLQVVEKASRLVRSQVPSAIELSVHIHKDLILPMDPQRMQEVFINLVINASQAIKGEGFIRISADVLPGEEMVLIAVKDSGEGVPVEIQDRLFDPFFTTKEEGHGTGLGLSIVYGIIQRHHGEITVESEPGNGTTFHILLPFTPQANGSRI